MGREVRVYLSHIPSYVQKMESRGFLENFSLIMGLDNGESLVQRIRERHKAFENIYSPLSWVDSPLNYYDLNQLGTRR